MSEAADYQLPQGVIGLTGPVEKTAPGTLPLRGDLAHIALAGRYLAAHYVIPLVREVGGDKATLKLQPREDAESGAVLEPGSRVELLDEAGDWAWLCRGPRGPSGYLRRAALAAAGDDGA